MKKQINFPPRTVWQEEAFRDIIDAKGSGKVFVIKSLRQTGKSILSELLLLYYALNFRRTTSIIIEPTNSQNRKVFKEICLMMEGSNLISSANSSFLEIQFVNGSQILCKSAESRDNLRGFTVSGILVLDEAAYLSDEVFTITSAYVNKHRAPTLIVSTPLFKRGRFYESFINPENVSYDWSTYDVSDFLPPDKLEYYRKTLPTIKFTQDYLGQFTELQGSVFGDFSKCISNTIDNSEIEVMGIDWGSGNGGDFTSITVFNNSKQMVDLVYFNDKDATQTIEEINKIYNRWKPKTVIAEKNSIGSVYLDLLKRKLGHNIVPFNTTNDSKNAIINKLQVAFQNKEIQILNNDELLMELAGYEQQLTSSGKSTFNGVSGIHDDLIISTALAFSALNKYKINLI